MRRCLAQVLALAAVGVAAAASVATASAPPPLSAIDAEHFIATAKRQMAALGIPEPTEECDSRYGQTYLARWRGTGREVCTAAGGGNEGPTPPPTSRAFCASHPGAELTACVLRNLVLSDSGAFMGTDLVPPGTVPSVLPAGTPGSVQLACRLFDGAGGDSSSGQSSNKSSEALLRRRLGQDGFKQWIRAAFPQDDEDEDQGGATQGVGAEQVVASACTGRGLGGAAIERPVLLLSRVDGLNAFHTLEGLLSVFSALAVAAPEMRRAGILAGGQEGEEQEGDGEAGTGKPSWRQAEVVLADQAWPGPFLDIWRQLAAGAGQRRRRRSTHSGQAAPPPRDGREASAAPLVRHLASRPFPAGTCLRRAVLLPYTAHGQSLLTYTGVGSDGRCGASPVAFGAALWIRHLLRAAAPRRGFLMAAAEAFERGGGEGGGGTGGEPFADGYTRDGVSAPLWYSRLEEDGGGASAALRFFGRKFGGGGAALDAASSSSSSSGGGKGAILPPYAPHIMRLKLVWLSRQHYEKHGAAGGSGGGGGGSSDSDEGRDAPASGPASSSWQRQRRLSPAAEREALLALQGAVLDWNARSCALFDSTAAAAAAASADEGGGSGGNGTDSSSSKPCRPSPVLFELEALELSDAPFLPDQAHALMRAGVLAGVHGAGLSNAVLLRPGCGAVVELWHNMRDNYHYQNLAAMLGHGYERLESEGDKVDAAGLARAAMGAMDRAAERHVVAARALLREQRQRRREQEEGGGQGAFPWGFGRRR